jgi:uncharacterized repeat protein (TIGR01451 family)
LARALFGEVRYTPPAWITGTWTWLRLHPARLGFAVLMLGIAGFGAMKSWQWWDQHRTRERQFIEERSITAKLTAPDLTPVVKGEAQPKPIVLAFDKAAAKLEDIGKVNAPGITLSPAHQGVWKWTTDKTLVFTPAADWPAGTAYEVIADTAQLAKEVIFKDAPRWSFTTPALKAAWEDATFDTDLKQPDKHQVTARLRFTHPMKKGEVQKALRAEVVGQSPIFHVGGQVPDSLFEVIEAEGEDHRVFFVNSARIAIPAKEDYLKFTVAAGLQSTLGGTTSAEVSIKVRVPDIHSGFTIEGTETELIRTQEGEPEQFLFVDTSGYAALDEIAAHLEVWLLPKDKPKIGKEDAVEDYQWEAVGEITPAILKLAQRVPVKPVEVSEGDDAQLSTRHGFKFVAERPGFLFIKVKQGAKALGGFILARDHAAIASVPTFPQEVEILGKGGVLALNGERKVSLKSRGIEHLRVTLARVPSTQMNHLASFNQGRFDSPKFWSGLDETNIAHFHREIIDVPKQNDSQANYTTFDFAEALARQDKADPDSSRGMFFLIVEGVEPREEPEEGEEAEIIDEAAKDPDPTIAEWKALDEDDGGGEEESDEPTTKARRFILITDLGMVAKRSANGDRDIFLMSISKGDPVPGVPVTVIARNGEFLAQGNTDAEGHLRLASLEHYQKEKEPVAIAARLGNDLAFLPFVQAQVDEYDETQHRDRRVNYSRFDTAGIQSSDNEQLDAFLFTERGVYRPGDEVHVSGIVRRRDWSGELDGLPLTLSVINAREAEVVTEDITLPEDGFFDWSFTTDDTDPTGQYEIRLSVANSPDPYSARIGRTAIRLEDFQPDRMKLSSELSTARGLAWVQPQEVKAHLKLETLFGFPAANRRVTARLVLSPAEFAFEAYPDHLFHNRKAMEFNPEENEEDDTTPGKKVDLGELKTDDKGEAVFDLALERLSGGSFHLQFIAEGFEAEGGRSVQSAQSVLVAPMPYAIGYKQQANLDYIGKDTPRSLAFLCIGPDLKPLTAPSLTARVVRISHVNVLTTLESGKNAYVSTKREKTTLEQPLALPATGAEFMLPTSEAGDFRLELMDSTGAIVSACAFSVIGKGDPGRSLERDAELELKLARDSWNSGEPLELSLNAPYTGAGLITVERENVRAWKWFKSPTTASTQTILVPPGLEATGYVNVTFVRALDSQEIFASPLSYAVRPFTPNPDARRMIVELDVPAKAKPGDLLKIGYKSTQPGRIIVFGVDEGIHNITNYKLPQPLKHFLRKRQLEVETHQLLDLILPEFSLLSRSAFGGDEDEALKLNLNPFKRRKDAPVVFWSGLLECGPDRHETSYALPDYFDGSLKLMAVAVSAQQIGAAETKSTVRGPIVLTPNVPTFAAPGDEFDVSLTVANNLEGVAGFTEIQLKAVPNEQLEIIDRDAFNLALEPGREGTTRFRVKARDLPGNAEIIFTARAAGQNVQRRATLSVRPAAPYVTEVKSGYFRSAKQDVPLERTLYPHFRKAEAVVSALPIGLARGLEAYLAEYPHGCSEQITSRAMARLLLASEADFGFDQGESSEQLESAFRSLAARQNGDGSFGYWPGQSGAQSGALTVYVTHFLTEAKDSNHALPDGLMESALGYLTKLARTSPTNVDQADVQAAAIYLLTRNGQVTTNHLLALRDTIEKQNPKWRGTLAGAYMAGTYALLKKRAEGESLIRTWWNESDKQPKLESWLDDYTMDPKVKQAQGFAVLCKHFPEIAQRFGYDDLAIITEPIRANRFNTLSAAYGILALKAYSALAEQAGVKLTINALTKNGPPTLLLPEGTGLRRTSFDAGLPGLGFLLDQAGSDLGAFYQVTESGFDKSTGSAINNGLEVVREITGDDGSVLSKLRVGDGATVRIRVRNSSPEALTNVAVLDLMPGGFELEPNGLKPGANAVPGADYVDVREDRAVFFTNLAKGETKTFSYRVKPVCTGQFIVPPVFAECMYDRGVKGSAGGGSITVE